MKECKYQGVMTEDGCIICLKDGSRRKAENCCRERCHRWERTLIEKIARWLKYGRWE